MEKIEHKCNEKCICPIDGSPFSYSDYWKEHACSNMYCMYSKGFELEKMAEFQRARFND